MNLDGRGGGGGWSAFLQYVWMGVCMRATSSCTAQEYVPLHASSINKPYLSMHWVHSAAVPTEQLAKVGNSVIGL